MSARARSAQYSDANPVVATKALQDQGGMWHCSPELPDGPPGALPKVPLAHGAPGAPDRFLREGLSRPRGPQRPLEAQRAPAGLGRVWQRPAPGYQRRFLRPRRRMPRVTLPQLYSASLSSERLSSAVSVPASMNTSSSSSSLSSSSSVEGTTHLLPALHLHLLAGLPAGLAPPAALGSHGPSPTTTTLTRRRRRGRVGGVLGRPDGLSLTTNDEGDGMHDDAMMASLSSSVLFPIARRRSSPEPIWLQEARAPPSVRTAWPTQWRWRPWPRRPLVFLPAPPDAHPHPSV